ncbi:MAG: carboxyl transferase [Clostridiales bacterium]|nr:carboxyl transferase [Clostridiales bacterium]
MENKTQNSAPKFKSAAELRALMQSEASTANERIRSLFDEGTFAEVGAYAHKIAAELDGSNGELESVVCGYGAIDGRLVFAFAQDFSRMKGALGAMHAKKICDLYELAIKNGAPVIGIFDSAGAYVLEGVEALAGYGKIMKKVSDASGVIPQIAVIAGVCGGAMAAVASMFDIVIGAEKGGSLYVNPPFVLNNLEKGANFGTIKTAAEGGLVNVVCADDTAALAYVRTLLAYIPQNNADGTAYSSTTDEINRLVDVESIISGDGYSMAEVIEAISDDAKFLELSAEYGKSMLTGFVTMNGMVIGVVANQPAVNGGKLCADAAKKASKFISFCDCFDIPLLTLVDTEGYAVSVESEKAQYGAALAKLASAYASSDNAKVTVVLGKAYGAAYTLMGSKSIGADIALAVDSAKISAMPTSSAVAFAWNDKVTDNAKRGEIEAEWDSVMASPVAAAKSGEIDDIISIDELRQRVSAAFEMLGAKNALCIEKRHNNLPL